MVVRVDLAAPGASKIEAAAQEMHVQPAAVATARSTIHNGSVDHCQIYGLLRNGWWLRKWACCGWLGMPHVQEWR